MSLKLYCQSSILLWILSDNEPELKRDEALFEKAVLDSFCSTHCANFCLARYYKGKGLKMETFKGEFAPGKPKEFKN